MSLFQDSRDRSSYIIRSIETESNDGGYDDIDDAGMHSSYVNASHHTEEYDYRDDDHSLEANSNNGRWTKIEHEMFLRGMSLWGRDWKKVQTAVKVSVKCLLRFSIHIFPLSSHFAYIS